MKEKKYLTKLNQIFKHDFFDKVDAPDKAYWLAYLYNVGVVLDDGYVSLSRTINNDLEGLVRFALAINLRSDILLKNALSTGGNYNTLSYYLAFESQQVTDGFYKYMGGGDSTRNESRRYPNIAPSMNRHFIRGLFESYSAVLKIYEESKPYLIRVYGDYEMLRTVQKILREEAEVTSALLKSAASHQRLPHMLEISSQQALPDLILYLYDDVKYFNKRKYEQLMDIFNFVYSD